MLIMKITNSVKWTDKRSDLFYLIYFIYLILLLNVEKIKSKEFWSSNANDNRNNVE